MQDSKREKKMDNNISDSCHNFNCGNYPYCP